MKLFGMGHIGINTGNFERSLDFYTNILGCKQLNTVAMPEFSITNVELPDGGIIELFDYGPRTNRSVSDNSIVGYRHIAFIGEGVVEWEKYLVANCIEIRMAATAMPELGIRGLLFLDPDGTEVEIYEKL